MSGAAQPIHVPPGLEPEDAKTMVRKAIRGAREHRSSRRRQEAAAGFVHSLADFEQLREARCVAAYVSRPSEPGTEHLGAEALAEADVIIAPALAVDTAGARLGQGGGWYDRALGHKRPDAKVVALVFPEEIYDAADSPIPTEPHDVPVDGFATPSGWQWAERG